ncbi:hypothetical protein JW905_06530 [bacterium]|nr:hypothetical protein [candidate division CSSED10-310 bacterium]
MAVSRGWHNIRCWILIWCVSASLPPAAGVADRSGGAPKAPPAVMFSVRIDPGNGLRPCQVVDIPLHFQPGRLSPAQADHIAAVHAGDGSPVPVDVFREDTEAYEDGSIRLLHAVLETQPGHGAEHGVEYVITAGGLAPEMEFEPHERLWIQEREQEAVVATAHGTYVVTCQADISAPIDGLAVMEYACIQTFQEQLMGLFHFLDGIKLGDRDDSSTLIYAKPVLLKIRRSAVCAELFLTYRADHLKISGSGEVEACEPRSTAYARLRFSRNDPLVLVDTVRDFTTPITSHGPLLAGAVFLQDTSGKKLQAEMGSPALDTNLMVAPAAAERLRRKLENQPWQVPNGVLFPQLAALTSEGACNLPVERLRLTPHWFSVKTGKRIACLFTRQWNSDPLTPACWTARFGDFKGWSLGYAPGAVPAGEYHSSLAVLLNQAIPVDPAAFAGTLARPPEPVVTEVTP